MHLNIVHTKTKDFLDVISRSMREEEPTNGNYTERFKDQSRVNEYDANRGALLYRN